VVAIGVRQDGSREVLGFDVGASETYEFWAEFLRQLVGRGLRAEAPQARPRPYSGSGPHRLRLKGTGRQLDQVCATLRRRFPQVAHMLQEAAEEVLTYMHFPPES
jgi:transposase-like protein